MTPKKGSASELKKEYDKALQTEAREKGLPIVPDSSPADAIWRMPSSVKTITDKLRQWSQWMDKDFTWAVNVGKLAPEARPFIVLRLRRLAKKLNKKADELEAMK
jgi:hypothetical protein